VFNNYGPKSNEELLLSYGFVIENNPDDTVILRLAGQAGAGTTPEPATHAGGRYVLRRNGEIPQELLVVLRQMMGGSHTHHAGCGHDHKDEDDEDEDEEDEHAAYEKEQAEMELEMDVLGTLGGMLEDKLGKLQVDVQEGGRDYVRTMCDIYRKGMLLPSTQSGSIV
jgi:hypothetical protein